METMDAIQDALGPKIDLVEAILRMPKRNTRDGSNGV